MNTNRDYIREFRDAAKVRALVDEINRLGSGKSVRIMEVCGTHTMSIRRFGIHKLVPEGIELISGPGCPVCVSPTPYIDTSLLLARQPDTIITTFGDMMKVPGEFGSLEEERAKGADVRVVYSCFEALKIAQQNTQKSVVFLAVGFETTAPTIAATVLEAHKLGVKNFFIYTGNKVIPPALEALLSDTQIRINALLLPGHVSTIIGSRIYEFIPKQYGIPCAIAGFEPVDILLAIKSLLEQIEHNAPQVANLYPRSVRPEGNQKALALLDEIFETADSRWRGIGIIPQSGLVLRSKYHNFDALSALGVEEANTSDNPACRCGDVLKGLVSPRDCPLFGTVCTPASPQGPCMVSSEGTCAAHYKYGT